MKCDNKYRLNRCLIKKSYKLGVFSKQAIKIKKPLKTINNECGN